MVALIDYECNVCGNDPEYVDHCSTCKGTGGLRLPAGCKVQAVEKEIVCENHGVIAAAEIAFEEWFLIEFGYHVDDVPQTADQHRRAFIAGYLARSG